MSSYAAAANEKLYCTMLKMAARAGQEPGENEYNQPNWKSVYLPCCHTQFRIICWDNRLLYGRFRLAT
jgi:hypothetical protein